MGKQNKLLAYADWRLNESLKEYDFYFKRYERILRTMFDWTNLPDGISEIFLEKVLFTSGMCVFFKNKGGFFQVARATAIGLNEYEEPIGYHTVQANGVGGVYLKAEDCVVIRNNAFGESSVSDVHFFAKKLSNIEKTITVNLEQLKKPFIITCPEGMESSVENYFTEKGNGAEYIIVKEAFYNNVQFKIVPLNVANNVPQLENSLKIESNSGLTFFGINNVNILKRERLTTGESSDNDEEVILSKNAMYKTRKKAVAEINNKWGLEVGVGLSSTLYDDVLSIMKGEYQKDGVLFHDDNGVD